MAEDEPKIIKLTIQDKESRDALLLALANSGIKVWLQEDYVGGIVQNRYWVCFEYNED